MLKNYPLWFAPAKLNLFLHITGKRSDGYHNLQTLFQLLDHGDKLQFIPRNDNKFEAKYMIQGIKADNDLILKAANMLYQYAIKNDLTDKKKNYGMDIYLQKNLPMGGGLGGGSSDAATTLNALNQIWKLHLDKPILAEIGLKLGADVPVFVYGDSCWAEGVGEKLTKVSIPGSYYVVVNPNVHVSTAELFSDIGLKRNCPSIDHYDFHQTENVFEPIVRKKYPIIEQAFEWLALFAEPRLTGTGACVFISQQSKEDCLAILNKLPDSYSGFYAKGI
ncbi:MAG: 4-(cytidine 5'-diphospho)-2-C-methyl-D-erythritol kinase [Pseudomonadota bacterium]